MRCSPDSSTTNESSPPRLAPTLAVGSRNSEMSVESSPGKSLPPPLPALPRRHETNARRAINTARIPAGSHQFAVAQSIQEPDSAVTGFFTIGAAFGAGTGIGVGVVFSAGGGDGVGVDAVVFGCVASTGGGVGVGTGTCAVGC